MAEMTPTSRTFVAGHRGLVGSAVVRRLEHLGVAEREGRSGLSPDNLARAYGENEPEYSARDVRHP